MRPYGRVRFQNTLAPLPYILIESWCLGYAGNYLTGDLMLGGGGGIDRLVGQAETNGASNAEAVSEAYKTFFTNFVGSNQNGFAMGAGTYGGRWQWVLTGVFLFNFALIYRGVTKGIERFCRIAMAAYGSPRIDRSRTSAYARHSGSFETGTVGAGRFDPGYLPE
jgi:SNF family Na+-dependent transporter